MPGIIRSAAHSGNIPCSYKYEGRHTDLHAFPSVKNTRVDTTFRDQRSYFGFEVLTAVVMKTTLFWDITPCSSFKFNRRFGGTYRLHLQGRRISRARNQHEGDRKQSLMPVDFQRTTRRYIPEDSTFQRSY
jgi:hypothetical protein